MNATKEVVLGKAANGLDDVPTNKGDEEGLHQMPNDEAGEDSDADGNVMDRMMDEMLAAEMGGYGDEIEDDFDALHRDDSDILRQREVKKQPKSPAHHKKNKAGRRRAERLPETKVKASTIKALGITKLGKRKKMAKQMRPSRA